MDGAPADGAASGRAWTFSDLVLPDLLTMESSGQYDRDVLLHLQERIVREVPGERSRDTVIEFYRRIRRAGGGVGISAYKDAAREFYGREAARHFSQFADLGRSLLQSIGAGHLPDYDVLGRAVWVSKQHVIRIAASLEKLGCRDEVAEIVATLKSSFDTISRLSVCVDGVTIYAGRDLLKRAGEIERHPGLFLDVVSARAPRRDARDFAPAKRR